jgi:hypothetical protein
MWHIVLIVWWWWLQSCWCFRTNLNQFWFGFFAIIFSSSFRINLLKFFSAFVFLLIIAYVIEMFVWIIDIDNIILVSSIFWYKWFSHLSWHIILLVQRSWHCMHQWFFNVACLLDLICSLISICFILSILSQYQFIKRIILLFEAWVLSLYFIDFILSLFTLSYLSQFFLFFFLEVFVNCTLLEKFFHVLSFLQFMSNINFSCLLTQAIIIIIWWIWVRCVLLLRLATKWFLYFLKFELSKLETLLSFIKFLFC